MLLEYLIDNNNIDIESDQRRLVQSLILGEIKPAESKEFYYDSWIYQIVANKKNSIDVDKFDYLCRDAYHIGLQSSQVDYERIFSSVKITENNLCFNIKVNIKTIFYN
jgi:HD superfamily phosphohydrolase